MVEFCQTFFKLYDIGTDVFQFSIDWAPSIPTQENGWNCVVHVIKHMQTFNNGDSMTVSDLCNSVKLRREITSDLVLHGGNREKQTIVAIICTKMST
uniref:Ubiquitin-like protease family profile domain-containing protein n=1 Tax=Vitis vinifera TaxID=29760 RepID=F6HBE2_VITVI